MDVAFQGTAAWNRWICSADTLPPRFSWKRGAGLEPKKEHFIEARAFLRRANLVDRDLAGFDLRRVDLQAADLRQSVLINAALTDSHVEGADFSARTMSKH